MRRVLLALTVLSLVPSCKAKELEAKLANVQGQLDDTERQLAQKKQENTELDAQSKTYQARIGELEGELSQVNDQLTALAAEQGVTMKELSELRADKAKREKELSVYKGLFSQLKKLVDAGTIEVGFRKGRMVVKLSNAILFASGRSKLEPAGIEAVAQLVPALNSVGKRDFLVAGHTDSDTIKTARYKSNWELSSARALIMVKTMIAEGYPPQQIGAAGFGEYDPVASNDTPEGKALNRRIEIILMPQLGEIPGMQEMLKGS
ncbi:MAG: OmpA family protein [Nannocystaceae bacterium]|nr:OmpA family protein [Nannocystaceae bacterium]